MCIRCIRFYSNARWEHRMAGVRYCMDSGPYRMVKPERRQREQQLRWSNTPCCKR